MNKPANELQPQWIKPEFEEIALSSEIAMYSSAEMPAEPQPL